MIGGIIDKIRAAEEKAEGIISNAKKNALEIENNAGIQIQNIKKETDEAVARIRLKSPAHSVGTPFTKGGIAEITVSPEKIEQAKKYIIAEYKKRYKRL